MNKAIIIGNVGMIKDGNSPFKFSVATSEKWTTKEGEKKEATEWHNIVVFGNQGSALQSFLQKGHKVAVEGKISTSSYEKDGQKMFSTSIIASNVQVLTPKSDSDTAGFNA